MDMNNFTSRTFENKDGIKFETKPHFASFDEVHNASKAKALIILYHRRYKLNQASGLSLGELYHASGVGYNYLKSRIGKWCEWQYIRKTVKVQNNKPCYAYSIDERGKHFIEDILPTEWLQKYVDSIKLLRDKI